MYYAVKKGNKIGIFETWDECNLAIKGFSNADFKKFPTKEEANAYLSGIDIWQDKVNKDIESGYTVAFTDGSFIDGIDKYGYGAVIIKQTDDITELCGSDTNNKYLPSRNIAGEVFAVISTLDWAITNNVFKLKIYHDYEGISKWLDGSWTANSDIAQLYTSFYNNKFKDLFQEIKFEHVKGHSNSKYNDMADNLAKSAIQEHKSITVGGDNWFKITAVSKENLDAILDLLSQESISITETNTPNGYKYKLEQETNILHLTHYQNNTILLQGKQSSLFQLAISLMSEFLIFDITEIMSNAYRKNIDKSKVENDFHNIINKIPDDYPDGYIKQIKQSIINISYYIESLDYSYYAVPALRALEGHIKYMIQKYTSHQINRTFDCFNRSNPSDPRSSYICTLTFSDMQKKVSVEECYNYYKSQRDTIDHAGDLMGKIDNTRSCSTKEEVDEIIKKCLSLISNQLMSI